MPPTQKRKRSQPPVASTSEVEGDCGYEERAVDNEIDISSALTGKKRPRVDQNDDDDDDDDLNIFIQESISKRDKKTGTEVMKQVKGKSKVAKGEVGGGSFQSMGLHPSLLRSLTLQGFRVPTPIQRLSIPVLLSNPPRDLVGMARTGSGKSLAFMIPLVQRLCGKHSATFGARALILLPTRELALQLLKVGKELARNWIVGDTDHAGDKKGKERENSNDSNGKGQNLRWGLVVGGEGLDEQFEMISNNPDVIIATPGRLLHLIVEMNLDLKSVQYVVFDEADRLFEMGFETALTEILQRLPTTRQTLLYSATLPKSLVEFAKAGLQNPKLMRLDTESKISPDLRMAFFSVKQAEKEACLLSLLRDVIKVPFKVDQLVSSQAPKHAKGKNKHPDLFTTPHQTLIFAATKHHIEYLTTLLTTAGYAVSHIYGTLDQAARTFQMDQFRRGVTSILVVTDVAARGIDIPVLENVVNFDFPQGARIFVHRVGRTARAGRQGWAWSFVTNVELPHLLDLQLFLSRPLRSGMLEGESESSYVDSLVLGTFSQEKIDGDLEYIRSLDQMNHSLPSLRQVMQRGHAMYERSKGKASPASYQRAKEMMKDTRGRWQLAGTNSGIHPVLLKTSSNAEARQIREGESKKQALLKAVNSFRPVEIVFEIGNKGKNSSETAALMKSRRKALEKSRERLTRAMEEHEESSDEDNDAIPRQDVEMANEDEITAAFDNSSKKNSFRDDEFYLSHTQKGASSEKGYSLTDGASFIEQANNATFDLAVDEALTDRKKRTLNWDKRKKKFIKGDGVGADNKKLIKTESGVRLPASYRSGRFDEWKTKSKVHLPRIGEAENPSVQGRKPIGVGGRRFKHHKVVEAKPLNKLNKDYERKQRQHVKREGKMAGDSGGRGSSSSSAHNSMSSHVRRGSKFGGRNTGKSLGRVKSELKTADQIRKGRKLVENRRAKNARPSKRGKH